MNKTKISLSFLSFAVASIASANAPADSGDNHARLHPKIAIDIGGYYPNDGDIRDVFGTGIKVGLSPVTHIANKWRLAGDLGAIVASKSGNKLFIGDANVALESAFGQEGGAQPYARISGGLAYNDHSFDLNSVHVSSKNFGPDAAAEVGVTFNNKVRLSARYNVFPNEDGFSFSGFTYSLQYTIGRL
jgi:hypothetical protein